MTRNLAALQVRSVKVRVRVTDSHLPLFVHHIHIFCIDDDFADALRWAVWEKSFQ